MLKAYLVSIDKAGYGHDLLSLFKLAFPENSPARSEFWKGLSKMSGLPIEGFEKTLKDTSLNFPDFRYSYENSDIRKRGYVPKSTTNPGFLIYASRHLEEIIVSSGKVGELPDFRKEGLYAKDAKFGLLDYQTHKAIP